MFVHKFNTGQIVQMCMDIVIKLYSFQLNW